MPVSKLSPKEIADGIRGMIWAMGVSQQNIRMRMQFIAKEFNFHLHILTDEVLDLGLMHQSSGLLQSKRNMLHLLAWRADKRSSTQGLDYILELSGQFRQSCLVSR